MLPNNGSIVIIDDKIEEAMPILKMLSKNNTAYRYYDGPSSLPTTGHEKKAIRVLFLDYNLNVGVVSEDSQVSTIKGIISRIIKPENGPYVIFAWSSSQTCEQSLNKVFEGALSHLGPCDTIVLDKSDYFDSNPEGAYVFKTEKEEQLQNEILNKIREILLLEYYSHWENKVVGISQKIVYESYKVVSGLEGQDRGSEVAEKIIQVLAKIRLEKAIQGADNKLVVASSYYSLNDVFLNHLNIETDSISLNNENSISITHENDSITAISKGKISSWLNINTLKNSSHIGKVFFDNDNSFDTSCLLKDSTLANLEEITRNSEESFGQISVEISPECDFANNKRRFYRIVPGVAISEDWIKERTKKKDLDMVISYKDNKKVAEPKSKLSNNILFLGPYESTEQRKRIYLFLDLAQFKTVPISDKEGNDYIQQKEVLFSLNMLLVQHIKQALAGLIQKIGYPNL